MLKVLKKNKKAKKYTDEELFPALKQDCINVTKGEVRKARQNDGNTLYKIGVEYYSSKEYIKAFSWFDKAALENHGGAQNKIGVMYNHGYSVSQDYELAMEWYQKAASNGSNKAQLNIALLHHYGKGVPVDYKQAMVWYQTAAENGNVEALANIASLYRDGEGVTKNIDAAIEWYTKAANQGHAISQYNLGYIYKYSEEYKDLQMAVKWYQKAADNNHGYSRAIVAKLNAQGYYADYGEEDEQVHNTNDRNGDINPTANNPCNEENGDKSSDANMKALIDTIQKRMSLIEKKNEENKREKEILQKEMTRKDEENRQLREELAKMKAELDAKTSNYTDCASSNGNNSSENGVSYKTEYRNNGSEDDHGDRSSAYLQIPTRLDSDQDYADPNYSSSDNEDPKNDIYYD